MPNWTHNYLTIQGKEADIRAFLEAIKSKDELFDFNRIILMPDLLKRTGSGSKTIDGREVRSWYEITPYECGQEYQVRHFTPAENAELDAIGHRDSLAWASANWGTRTNSCNVDIDDSDIHRGCIIMTFDTSWSAPVPILKKLIEMFPRLSFDGRWRDEFEYDRVEPHSLNETA